MKNRVCEKTLVIFGTVGRDRESATDTGSIPSLTCIIALYTQDRSRASREGSRPSLSLRSFFSAVFPTLPPIAPFSAASQWNVP